jgi:Zn-dependent protease with chaperone function
MPPPTFREDLPVLLVWVIFFGGLLVGLWTYTRLLLQLVRALWVYFLRPGRDLRKLGDWAVVTGATDGIGKAYAERLAGRGRQCMRVSSLCCILHPAIAGNMRVDQDVTPDRVSTSVQASTSF